MSTLSTPKKPSGFVQRPRVQPPNGLAWVVKQWLTSEVDIGTVSGGTSTRQPGQRG